MSIVASLITFAGIAVLVAAFAWLAKRSGRIEAERDAAEQAADRGRIRHEIDESVARLSDDALNDELRRPR